MPSVPSGGELDRYIQEVMTVPILSANEELALATRWRDHNDIQAAHRIITGHLRLVIKIAMRYRGYQLPVCDLISEGNIGLMKAVRKFDPDRGVRVSTYATLWIKASILEFVLKSWSLVSVGSQTVRRRLFFGLSRMKARLQIVDDGNLDHEEVGQLASEFGVSMDDVIEFNHRFSRRDLSLNTPLSVDTQYEHIDVLVDSGPDPEVAFSLAEDRSDYHKIVVDALDHLSEREAEVIRARWLNDEKTTLAVLSQKFGVSRERIRQVELRALRLIKEHIGGLDEFTSLNLPKTLQCSRQLENLTDMAASSLLPASSVESQPKASRRIEAL